MDAFGAVSQQFHDRTSAVIEGVMSHLRDDNAQEILGPGLAPLTGRGSLKSIVTFAVYADVLRTVQDLVMADGVISDEEVGHSVGLLSILAATFAKVRKEYAPYATLSALNARDFLGHYRNDVGLFGHANTATKWAGLKLCQAVREHCGDSRPLSNLNAALGEWSLVIASSRRNFEREQSVGDTSRSGAQARQPLNSEFPARSSDDARSPDDQVIAGNATGPQGRVEKACPFCGERILAVAIKCKHCGERLDRDQTQAPPIPDFVDAFQAATTSTQTDSTIFIEYPEIKRTCNRCGNLWFSDSQKEEMLELSVKAGAISNLFGMAAVGVGGYGRAGGILSKDDRDREMQKLDSDSDRLEALRRCSRCNSTSFTEVKPPKPAPPPRSSEIKDSGRASYKAGRAVREMSSLLLPLLIVVSIILAIGLLVAGLQNWTSNRTNALREAISHSRWDDALKIDPRNVLCLLGRARDKLTGGLLDVEAALADIAAAEQLAPGSSDVKSTRAAALAARVIALANTGKLTDAEKELEGARSAGIDDAVLAAAHEAIVTAWMARAEAAAEKKQPNEVKRAVDAAARTVAPERIKQLRARGLILESVALVSNQSAAGAVEKVSEASALDVSSVKISLQHPANTVLRQAVIAAYCKTFNSDLHRFLPPTLPLFSVEEFGSAAPLSNSVGITFKLIPGDSRGLPPFFISVCEVSNSQWKRVMGSVPSHWKDDDQPVESISWSDAVVFCRELSSLPEEKTAGRVYRIPTEEEWEFACRAGTTTTYSFGNDVSQLGTFAWFEGNAHGQPHPVGEKKPNAFGLFDMHGNVAEWCSSEGPQGESNWYSLRGGSWFADASSCQSASKQSIFEQQTYTGCRLVITVPGAKRVSEH